jgi:hypothetical protein
VSDVSKSPLQGGSLAIDFANTAWFSGGKIVDALADDASAEWWLGAVAEQLARAGCPPGSVPMSRRVRDQLVETRRQVRHCLTAVSQDRPVPDDARRYLNEQTSRAPRWNELQSDRRGQRNVSMRRGSAVHALLAALCESAIDVAATSAARACECPNCIGFFPPAPRRRFCSPQCSTRVRVERHRRSRVEIP